MPMYCLNASRSENVQKLSENANFIIAGVAFEIQQKPHMLVIQSTFCALY